MVLSNKISLGNERRDNMGYIELKNKFNSYEHNGRTYYGGNQMLSSDKTIKRCGCGVIAAVDLFLYMHKYHEDCNCPVFKDFDANASLPAEEILPLYKPLSRYFALIPPFGINGMMLALGINAFFLRYKYPYYARWGVLHSRMWDSIEEMLDNDLPVILSVGPDFPRIWQKHSAVMYRESGAAHAQGTKVRAHFMTLTAMDEKWLYVSSWGKKFCIDREEYLHYSKCYTTQIASNIVYIIPLSSNPGINGC